MLQTSTETRYVEDRTLAPYAVHSGRSHGRVYAEPPHPYRSDFQRDRDRIIHSRCFRRLEYKTQVFVNGTADHYRTRLTHTHEMTAVGRTLARALGANEDLTECIALAHDIGHSPFGHVGEETLDALMQEHGGFEHNSQSVRWVEVLEQPYPDFPGLNLTWEVRAGLRKHQAHLSDAAVDGRPIGPHQQLEAQIADIADDITYHAHDVDDGLDAGLLDEARLSALPFWRLAAEQVRTRYGALHDEHRRHLTVRNLLDLAVEDILRTSAARLEQYDPRSPDDVMQCPVRLVAFSEDMQALHEETRAFLFANMYFHHAVADANRESARLMGRLFRHYVDHPETMGRKAQARMERDGVWRAACDYVSGMTDRYALEQVREFRLDAADGAGGGATTQEGNS
jgi:dGTPase